MTGVFAVPAGAEGSRLARRAAGRARVDAIFSATMDLLRDHKPQDVTVSMVASHAGIKRPSIYAHFSGMAAIFEELSRTYIDRTYEVVDSFVRQAQPQTLEELLVAVIEGICKCFNEMRDSNDLTSAGANRFILHNVVRNFDAVAANFYRTHWTVDWPVEPLSELDPFRVLVTAQMAIFSTSIERHGVITPGAEHHAKLLAVTYIKGVEQSFAAQLDRIDDATPTDLHARLKSLMEQIEQIDRALVEPTLRYLESIAVIVAR